MEGETDGCLIYSKGHKNKADNISLQSFYFCIGMTDQYKSSVNDGLEVVCNL